MVRAAARGGRRGGRHRHRAVRGLARIQGLSPCAPCRRGRICSGVHEGQVSARRDGHGAPPPRAPRRRAAPPSRARARRSGGGGLAEGRGETRASSERGQAEIRRRRAHLGAARDARLRPRDQVGRRLSSSVVEVAGFDEQRRRPRLGGELRRDRGPRGELSPPLPQGARRGCRSRASTRAGGACHPVRGPAGPGLPPEASPTAAASPRCCASTRPRTCGSARAAAAAAGARGGVDVRVRLRRLHGRRPRARPRRPRRVGDGHPARQARPVRGVRRRRPAPHRAGRDRRERRGRGRQHGAARRRGDESQAQARALARATRAGADGAARLTAAYYAEEEEEEEARSTRPDARVRGGLRRPRPAPV